jgi:hypothetical protein
VRLAPSVGAPLSFGQAQGAAPTAWIITEKHMSNSDEKLASLLKDLYEMSDYLHSRGNKTKALSEQFAQNAQKDSSHRDFDLNQSRMLDYQHHLWHEVGNLIDKLIKKYE